MRKIGIILLLTLACSFAQAQSSMLAGVRLLDTKQKPIPNEKITFRETTTGDTLSAITSAEGTVQVQIDGGKEWEILFMGAKYQSNIKMGPDGRRGRTKISITYDPRKYAAQVVHDRSTITFVEEDQARKHFTRAKPGMAVVNVKLVGRDGKSFASNQNMALVNYGTNTKYLGVTDSYGQASFMVPIGQTYSVDVGTAEDYTNFEVPAREGMIVGQRILYVATKLKEKTTNDTIFQQLKPDQNDGTSERVFVQIQVKNQTKPEPVILHAVKGKSIYKTMTDNTGIARFLLPKNQKFMVHFAYQRDVDVVDLVNMWGIGTVELKLNYQPDPMLEHPETYLPTPDRLLLREINYFLTQQFRRPVGKKKADFFFWWGNPVNKNSKEAVLQIGFSTAETNSDVHHEPLNVAFVVDKSGSMAGYDRIESLQRSMITFVDRLSSNDIVSLVTFDTETTVLIPNQKKGDGKLLKEKIGGIIPGGGTVIFDGMVAGYEQVLKNYSKQATNRVVLLTDGYGTVPVDSIVNKSKEYNARGVELSAIGVGYDFNQALLTLLASEGGGLLQHAGEAAGIDTVFSNELQSILNPIGKEAMFEIEYNKRIVFKQIYGMAAQPTGKDKQTIKLGKLYAGLNKVALVKFDLHKPSSSIEKEPVTLRLTYTDYVSKKPVVLEKEVYLKWSESKGELEIVKDQEHKKLYAIAILNQAMKVMAEANAAKKFDEARDVLVSTKAQIEKLFPKADQQDVQTLLLQLEGYLKTLDLIAQKRNIK